jgi:radical SAM family protein/B12 binding protein
MRVLFVQNLLLNSSNKSSNLLQPHLGLLSLVAAVERTHHQGLLYDPMLALAREELVLDNDFYQEMACAILRQEPDVVGFTSLGCNFIATVKVSAYLKSVAPDLPILLGGPHATVLHREILERFSQFDLIVRNEAEDKIIPVLDALPDRSFHHIPGVSFRQDGDFAVTPGESVIADLDTLPWPAYDHYPIEELGLTSLRVEAGRGCPFDCTFCSTATFFGRRYRLKSPLRLCAELDYLHARYGISDFSLQHDLFTVNRDKVLSFCAEVAPRGYTWSCSARIDCVDPELLEQMQHAGCRRIYYGIETGSPRMQRITKKHLDLALVDPILDATQRLAIEPTVSFITGYPQEEQPDQDRTLDMVGACFYRIPPVHNVQLHLLTPEPGTQLITEFGGILAYDGHVSDFNFPALQADDNAIMARNPSIFMNHHYYATPIRRKRNVFVTSISAVLSHLGATFAGHLCGLYSGRLSALISDMFDWAEQEAWKAPFDNQFVVCYCESKWGKDHYLYSVARYLTHAQRLASIEKVSEEKQADHPRQGSTSGTRRYALSHRVALLRDLHHVPEILQFIEATASVPVQIPHALRTERSDYLILLDDRRRGTVRNFILDHFSASLLEEFATTDPEPHHFSWIHQADGWSPGSASWLDELLHLGVLVDQPAECSLT